MKTASLIKQIRQHGIDIKVSGKNLELIFKKDDIDSSILDLIKKNKKSIIEYFKSIDSGNRLAQIPLATKKDVYSITSAQLRFWILCQMDEINRAYNLPVILSLEGDLNIPILETALKRLISRHEILRSHFVKTNDGLIAQKVLEPVTPEFKLDVEHANEQNAIKEWINRFVSTPFELLDTTLLKVALVQKSNKEHLLCLNMHHIISDGASLEILLSDLAKIYNGLSDNSTIDLHELKVQFKDFVEWKNNIKDQDKNKEYWLDRFSGEIPLVNLPTYQPRPALKTYNGQTYVHSISKKAFSQLRKFSKKNKGTLFTALMSVLNGILYRYTNQTDIVLGTPVSGRNHPDLEHQIGLYINTLPIRMQFGTNDSFQELFLLQKQTMESAYVHSDYSFGDLVNGLSLPRDTSRSPIFDILVIQQQQRDDSFRIQSAFKNLECSLYPELEHTVSKYDLTFTFSEEENELKLYIEYNTDLFLEKFIADLAVNFENFAQLALENPKLPINEIQYLDPKQKHQLIYQFNSSAFKYDSEKTVVSCFQEQVSRTPNRIALVCEGSEISYADLHEKSDYFAYYLRARGVTPKSIIGICIGRSKEMVISILAILKIGGSYLPLDPFYPIDRTDYIIEHSGAQFIIADSQTKSIVSGNVVVIDMDDVKEWERENLEELPVIKSGTLAYVIYTSGTTGKPKGVKVSHRNLMNFIVGMNQRFAGDAIDERVWLSVTSISFDISVLELLWTLTRGDKVVLHLETPVPLMAKPEMEFSLFYFPTGASSEINKYNLLLEGAVYADKNGFQAIWVPERHFHSFGDQFPNPSVAAAAVSTITSNIELRSGSVVLPLHDPVRVAEEWSMVDNLSGGRIGLSIASGWHPNDFVLEEGDYKNRHRQMREKITVLKNLWKGESITRKNGVGKDFEFKIHPKPIQKELPIWITAAGSIETFKYAGSIGANVLTHLLGQSLEDLSEKVKVYRQALQDNGYDPQQGKVALMLHTFIGENEETVRKIVEKPFKNYLRNSINLLKPIAEEQGLNLDSENDMETLLDMGFLRFYKTSSLFGTPDSCLEIVNRVYEAQVNEIACLIDFGVKEQLVLENLDFVTRLKDLVKRSKAQYDFVAGRLEKLSTNEGTTTLIEKHLVTHIQSTPSFYEELVLDQKGRNALQQIKTLLVGGEALKQSLANSLIEIVGKDIHNMYGPTETTIWSAVKTLRANEGITIGTPIANTKIYILDSTEYLCPMGVSGELCIGGDGVSQGYFKNEELTASKFIDNPFIPGEKIYKTGDLALWLPNGELKFLGRLDRQVKIKGYRIELKEIENVLLENPKVVQCAVSTMEIKQTTQLVAYINTKSKSIEDYRIKDFLRLRLPNYMIPKFIVRLDEFPKTPNGKIDFKKLPQPQVRGRDNTDKYIAPKNEIEAKLAQLWSDFLKIERVSIDANFFEIGGNSMKAFQLLSILNTELAADLKIISFFQYPTIRTLAENMGQNKASVQDRVEETELEDIDDIIEFMDSI